MQPEIFSLGPITTIPDPGVPIYPYFPDGHISYLKDGDEYQMYWAGGTSYRTLGTGLTAMKESVPVLRAGATGEFDNGGAWLYAVYRRDEKQLIGFYHAEDHEFKADPASRFIAWKSIALCLSGDNGRTWSKKGQIITSARKKPERPTWGGNGDFCVVRDEQNGRWVCFYQEGRLCMAVSSDPQGKPGTWKKFYRGAFTEAGLGGENTPIPELEKYPGGNPSVHFNSFLKKWVMVWHTWEDPKLGSYQGSVMLSTSADLIHWNEPQPLLEAKNPERFWYPTIIGESDTASGQSAQLVYAYFPNRSVNKREFLSRTITFGAGGPMPDISKVATPQD